MWRVQRAAEVEVSTVQVVPNLQRRKPEKLGEVGLSPVQLALKNSKRNPERAMGMPPDPVQVARWNRRKSREKVAEVGPSNSAGCAITESQQMPLLNKTFGSNHHPSVSNVTMVLGPV
jgi:hypothetical protein